MDSGESMVTFVNGIIAGAGAVVAVMAFVFIQLVAKYEGIMGVSTGEMRAAVILGGIVCAAAVGYEFYRKRSVKESTQSASGESSQGVSGE